LYEHIEHVDCKWSPVPWLPDLRPEYRITLKLVILYNYSASYINYNDADFQPAYVSTSTTALSADPTVAVPLLTINGWMLMQRKVINGSVSFNKNWAEYRDGFGSAAGNDNYWLGLAKVYRLLQFGNVRLRIEVLKQS